MFLFLVLFFAIGAIWLGAIALTLIVIGLFVWALAYFILCLGRHKISWGAIFSMLLLMPIMICMVIMLG